MLKHESIFVALVIATLASLVAATAAMADSLTVDFQSANYNNSTHVLNGTQTSTRSSGVAYAGTYQATGSVDEEGCVTNPTATLSFPSANGQPASVNLLLGSPLCLSDEFSGTFQIQAGSGTGVFKGAAGSGTATYSARTGVIFSDTSGSFFSAVPSPGATPELDSLMLFGSGGLAMAGYALVRMRARRKLPLR